MQLKEEEATSAQDKYLEFQFRKGAIKGQPLLYAVCTVTMFQFRKGAIKGLQDLGDISGIVQFQFRKGAIKGLNRFSPSPIW